MTDFAAIINDSMMVSLAATPVVYGGFTLPADNCNVIDGTELLSNTNRNLNRASTYPDDLELLIDGEVGEDTYFNRIWVYPQEVAQGFIVEDTSFTITIWNAYITQFETFNSLSVTNQPGSDLVNLDDSNISTPVVIPPLLANLYKLRLFKIGPPQQNSIYTFNISSLFIEVTVTGKRTEIFPFEPNWKNGVNIKLEMKTALFVASDFTEHRIPIAERPLRTLTAEFLEKDQHAESLRNFLKIFASKIISVPIYTEALTPSNSFSSDGVTSFVTTVDLTNCWHLQTQTLFFMLIDFMNRDGEIKEIDSISQFQINFKNPTVKAFGSNPIIGYPTMLAITPPPTGVNITPQIFQANLKFEEALLE